MAKFGLFNFSHKLFLAHLFQPEYFQELTIIIGWGTSYCDHWPFI